MHKGGDDSLAAPRAAGGCEHARKWDRRRDRKRYTELRADVSCARWGVVATGCKRIVGSQLERSGLRWSINGAKAIPWQATARNLVAVWDFWESRSAAN